MLGLYGNSNTLLALKKHTSWCMFLRGPAIIYSGNKNLRPIMCCARVLLLSHNNTCGCHNWGCSWSEWGLGILLHTSQCLGQPPHRECPALMLAVPGKRTLALPWLPPPTHTHRILVTLAHSWPLHLSFPFSLLWVGFLRGLFGLVWLSVPSRNIYSALACEGTFPELSWQV